MAIIGGVIQETINETLSSRLALTNQISVYDTATNQWNDITVGARDFFPRLELII
jgi:hypothetical protein